jgi:hypothetical protein
MEGVWTRRRRDFETAKASGTIIHDLSERVPNSKTFLKEFDSWQQQFIEPHLGRKFRAIWDGLRGELRDAIAHLDGDQPVISADELPDLGKCQGAIPILRYMARVLLAAEVEHERKASNVTSTGPATTHPTVPRRSTRKRSHRGR